MARDRTARTRIRQLLASAGPVVDPSGYATGVLKDAVGYEASAVAFIQLIAAMDRDGEIVREIRGKRTYSIAASESTVHEYGRTPVPQSGAMKGSTMSVPGFPGVELDYDRLARAVVQELVSTVLSRSVSASTAPSTNDAPEFDRDDYIQRLNAARSKVDELLREAEHRAAASQHS